MRLHNVLTMRYNNCINFNQIKFVMRNPILKLAFLAVLIFTGLISSAQVNSMNKKAVGVNFRNLWFGNSAEVIFKKPQAHDKWSRKVFRLSGNHIETDNQLTLQTGVPDAYRSDLNSSFAFAAEFGHEKHKKLIEDLYFYHGPAFTLNLGTTNYRTSTQSLIWPQYTKTVTHSFGFGVGYLGGIRYQVNERFGVQIDNLIQVRFNGNLQNQTEHIFKAQSWQEETNQVLTDKLRTNIQVPGNNISRIWLTFHF